MDHTVDAPPRARFHGHYETVVANGYQFLLQRALIGVLAQKGFERSLNGLAVILDFAPQPPQFERGVIVQRAIREDLAAQLAHQRAELADGRRRLSERCEAVAQR